MAASRVVQAQTAERRARAIEMRARGETWEAIADTLDYANRGAACNDVKRALDARLAEQALAADHLREVELEKLDRLERTVVAILEREHVTVSGGKVVVHDDRPLKDDGPALAAIDRYLRIQERRARLLGLDSPVRVDGGVTVRYEIIGVEMGALS